jgi:endonuclease/exonuclease/phosphatase family metal-dependent hydrolase
MRLRWAALAALVLVLGVRGTSCRDKRPALRFATFNIEDFPKDQRQIDGAFAEIEALHVDFLAVQEITDPAKFAAEAVNRLGGAWQFAAIDTAPPHPTHHLGVLFDTRRYTLVDVTSHDETRLGGLHKPTLEVRLRPAGGGDVLRLLVVHLKSGGDEVQTRAQQLAALRQIISYRNEHTIVLGDFNATSVLDRNNLRALSIDARLWWVTARLACSHFWQRDDGCFTSRLDHVLMWYSPDEVEAAGACATQGCGWDESCPLYADEVSDHCPVVVTIQ